MKKIPSLYMLTVITMLLFWTACKKDDCPPPGAHQWQISKLVVPPGDFNWADSAVFTYNYKGDPVSIIRGQPGTGATSSLFRYDARGRLQDYIGVYSDQELFEFWTHYYYDAQGRIAGDTVYFGGRVGENGPLPDPNGPPPYDQPHMTHTSAYHYDHQGRISEVVRTFRDGTSDSFRYAYNAAGNLERYSHVDEDGSIVSEIHYMEYDNKVNMHRTHPVWQLIDRNYSVNNPFIAEAYNRQGLPLTIHEPVKLGAGNFIGFLYERLYVTYKQCW